MTSCAGGVYLLVSFYLPREFDNCATAFVVVCLSTFYAFIILLIYFLSGESQSRL